MPEWIEPIVEKVAAVLEARTPALLAAVGCEAFRDYKHMGTMVNFPCVEVGPGRSDFDDESATSHGAHVVRVRFAVSGAEPDEVAGNAMKYMRAIHRALAASWPADWAGTLADGVVERVFVRSHDYGPLFESSGALARFPELELIVETQESWGAVEGV